MYAERFFDAGSASLAQGCDGLFVGDIAGDKDNSSRQLGTVPRHPGMDIGPVYSAWGTHIGYHSQEFSRLQQPQSFGAGLGAHDRVAAALQSGSDVSHHTGFVLDQ